MNFLILPLYHMLGYGQLLVDSVNDHNRVEYLSGYIGSTLDALR
jgi:beta-glucosidase